MASYLLKIHGRDLAAPMTDRIDVNSDADANDLAKITLLMTQACTHLEVYRDHTLVGVFKRDILGC